MKPVLNASTTWQNQQIQGGVAAPFNLNQQGDAYKDPGSTDIGYTGGQYFGGNKDPLMAAYVEGFEFLTCPADRIDYFWAQNVSSRRIASGTLKTPRRTNISDEVISYNISYLYIAGFDDQRAGAHRASRAVGDEANASDVGTDSWYGQRRRRDICVA